MSLLVVGELRSRYGGAKFSTPYLSWLVFTLAQWLDRLVQTRRLVLRGSKEKAHKWYRIRREVFN